MNKYHIARKSDFNIETLSHEVCYSIAFGGMVVSLQTATEYATGMNRHPESVGCYFPVPAPFAGEIQCSP